MKRQSSVPTIVIFLLRLVYFIAVVGAFFTLYKTVLLRIYDRNDIILSILLLWLITAYIVLPRIHRRLTKLYVPNYFIGRVRTYDGLLGDPVNLAVIGTKKQLVQAMKKAGWTQAEELTRKSALKMIYASVFKKSYKHAPVSSLYLFSRKQDVAFQMEVNNNPRKRHHVRFWRTPSGWWLPGGFQADWLGAATYDSRVGLSTFTGQITHKIAENVDEERDFVVHTLHKAKTTLQIHKVTHFTSGFHDKNGGGDRIYTDGSLPFITLK